VFKQRLAADEVAPTGRTRIRDFGDHLLKPAGRRGRPSPRSPAKLSEDLVGLADRDEEARSSDQRRRLVCPWQRAGFAGFAEGSIEMLKVKARNFIEF
jgi:hypothetical protein